MDEKIAGKIVEEVFEKAKKEHASHSKFALSNHVSNETNLSARTLERAYDRYINKKGEFGVPQADSIDLLCKYLGYEDFKDYAKHNTANGVIVEPPTFGIDKQKLIFTIGIAFCMILLIFGILKWPINESTAQKCMTWADSLYVPISCDTRPFSKFGTKVEPLRQMDLQNMKKEKVNQAFEFFSEDGKPLIWYYKNKDGGYEFFTAPGLHPVTGETLRKITPYIIQTYVPMHLDKKKSFVPE